MQPIDFIAFYFCIQLIKNIGKSKSYREFGTFKVLKISEKKEVGNGDGD